MVKFDVKMAGFRERWLGETSANPLDPRGDVTPGVAGRIVTPTPGLVFRERLVAPSGSGRGGPGSSPPRLGRVARRLFWALAATALAAAGLHQVFRYAPREVEALAPALSSQGLDFRSP
jgi:hypothetical protein